MRQTTRDGRAIVAPTQGPDGWRTFITGCADNPKVDSKNGTGDPIFLEFAGPEEKGMDIVLASPVFLHNGSIHREGNWSAKDKFSLSVKIDATFFEEGGNKDVKFVPIKGGNKDVKFVPINDAIGFWLPVEPSTGTHQFEQSKAFPVLATIAGAASWNIDEETSDVLPVIGASGPAMLVNFPVQSFFARNIHLGSDFYSDADQSEWVSNRWKLRLDVVKVSDGAGQVAGQIFTYRKSTF